MVPQPLAWPPLRNDLNTQMSLFFRDSAFQLSTCMPTHQLDLAVRSAGRYSKRNSGMYTRAYLRILFPSHRIICICMGALRDTVERGV